MLKLSLLTRIEISSTLCLLYFVVGGKILLQAAGLFHHDYKSDVPFTFLIILWTVFMLQLRSHPAISRGYVLKSE
jgi:hypothetical protein